MTARRLIKSGRDINLGSPDRELFENFKEKFWFQSIYKSHHGKLEKQVSAQKAWFFFHVYETVENYKTRCTSTSWRPWADPVIDVCNSSADESEPPPEKPIYSIIDEEEPMGPIPNPVIPIPVVTSS